MFNANNVPDSNPGDDFALMPNGIYDAEIAAVELKDANRPGSKYLNFQWKLNGPTHANRVVFDMITWQNANMQAVEIGHRNLAKCCKAIGRLQFQRPEELVGGRCQIRLGTKREDGYDDKNVIKSFIAYAQQTGQQRQPVSHQGYQQQQGGGYPQQPPQQPQPQPQQQHGGGYGGQAPQQNYQQQQGGGYQQPAADDVPF